MAPDIYRGWLEQPILNSLLKAHHLDTLSEELQVLLESAVAAVIDNNPSRYRKNSRALADELGLNIKLELTTGNKRGEGTQRIGGIARDIASFSRPSVETRRGTDPQLFEGQQHWRGMSHPQSGGDKE